MPRTPSDAYLEKARAMSPDELEQILSRSRDKLMRRLLEKKLSPEEAVAIQLEIEDEDLAAWRARMAEFRARDAEKASRKKDKS